MEWPSKNVPYGGILHPPKASCSPQTRDFLKVLMDESKLTMMQRKKVDYYLRRGEPLPAPKSGSNLTPTKVVPPILIRPCSSKRRSKDSILQSGAYEREKFKPVPKPDREKEKKRLQNKMAFGKDVDLRPPKPKPKIVEKGDGKEGNRFDQLVSEIEEREQWLKEMKGLGQGEQYNFIIQQQIQARVREMQKLKIASDHKS